MKLAMVFFGVTATGKSYVAQAWAKRWGCRYLNSDIVRKELAGRDPGSSQKAAINAGIYAPEFTRRTYDELIRRAEQALLEGTTSCVVLDASYLSRPERDLVRACLEGKCQVIFVHCTCPEEIVKERLAFRANDPHAVSDGRWDIYLKQKKDFAMPAELEEAGRLVTLETNRALPELLQLLEREVCAMGEGVCFSSSGRRKTERCCWGEE